MLSPLCRPAGQVLPAEPSAQVSFQERGQLVDGELSILTIDLENDLVTLLSSKSENGEDRLCVGRLLVFGQSNLALKSLGVLYEDCGRAGVQARLAPECDRSFHHVFHPLCSLSYFQDKENVAPGSHCPAGTTHDCPGPAGNNRTEHYLAPALDCCAVKVDDGGSGLNHLALGGDVLEALAFEFDCIEPNMYDKLNAIIVHAAVFHETIDAAGNTVRLRSHDNLGDLTALDYTGGAKTLEARLVDLSGIIDKEAQPCDTALHALHIGLATKRLEHLSSQYVVTVLRHRAFRRSRLPRLPRRSRTPRDLRTSLAFGQNPVSAQAGRGFTTAGRSQVEAGDEEAEYEVVQDGIDESNDDDQQGIARVGLAEVERVVDEPGGEAKAYPDAEKGTDCQRRPCQDGMNDKENRGNEDKGELDGFGDPCQEGGERR